MANPSCRVAVEADRPNDRVARISKSPPMPTEIWFSVDKEQIEARFDDTIAGLLGDHREHKSSKSSLCSWLLVITAPAGPDEAKFIEGGANLCDICLWRAHFRNLGSLLSHPRTQLIVFQYRENGGGDVVRIGRIEE